MVTRLAEQKGIDILLPVIEKIIQKGAGLVILGDGEKRYEDALKSITACCSEQMFLKIGFDNILAHKIMAGADMFLMPSRYEACGLTQIYSLKYGTLPIVHHTGGLADTVEDADLEKAQGNGFKFYSYTPQAKKGSGKAIIATARKLLTIIYRRLKNDWVFEDFNNFKLTSASKGYHLSPAQWGLSINGLVF